MLNDHVLLEVKGAKCEARFADMVHKGLSLRNSFVRAPWGPSADLGVGPSAECGEFDALS